MRIVDDVEANRLQIYFPERQPDTVVAALKGYGFRWTPSLGCWQRHRSNGANYAAECILKLLKPAVVAPEAPTGILLAAGESDEHGAARCACQRGSTCDVSHDPAACDCAGCNPHLSTGRTAR